LVAANRSNPLELTRFQWPAALESKHTMCVVLCRRVAGHAFKRQRARMRRPRLPRSHIPEHVGTLEPLFRTSAPVAAHRSRCRSWCTRACTPAGHRRGSAMLQPERRSVHIEVATQKETFQSSASMLRYSGFQSSRSSAGYSHSK
jgi:hypothetical protein